LHIRFGTCPCYRAGGGILFHIKLDSPAIAAPAEEEDDNETTYVLQNISPTMSCEEADYTNLQRRMHVAVTVAR
jgi:hypothetical protein